MIKIKPLYRHLNCRKIVKEKTLENKNSQSKVRGKTLVLEVDLMKSVIKGVPL